MAAAEAEEAYPGAGGIPVASPAVAIVTADVAGVAGVAMVAAAVGAAFGGGALIVAPAPGAVVPPPSDFVLYPNESLGRAIGSRR